MSLPDVVEAELGGEDPVARVHLGGDDELFVTPTRTLVYRAEGLLSDESVEEYPHEAERLSVSESRRKAKLTFEYGLDGSESLSMPRGKLEEVLHPVLAGVLSASDVTEPGETVERTFRFSELTLVVTSTRLVKHIGAAVWDEDYEAFRYDDVTDLDFEEGSVATTLVLTVNGRQERFKAPSDRTREVREALVGALTAHHGVESLGEFRARMAEEEETDGDEEDAEIDRTDFGGGPDPLSADPAQVDTDAGTREDQPAEQNAAADTSAGGDSSGEGGRPTGTAAASEVREDARTGGPGRTEMARDADVDRVGEEPFGGGFEPADPAEGTAAELAALREAVEEQSAQLRRQNELIERLIEELRRGR